jgi:hypothetical protein
MAIVVIIGRRMATLEINTGCPLGGTGFQPVSFATRPWAKVTNGLSRGTGFQFASFLQCGHRLKACATNGLFVAQAFRALLLFL